MSQTETILLIVLGFSLASLIALFIGRFMWTAAVKLGSRRMQRQVPSSVVGLQTERDRLRAEFAMLSQRMGDRLEEAKLRMAEHLAEVSRHRNRIHEIESQERARLAEIKRLTARVEELEQAQAEAKTREDELMRSLGAREDELRRIRKSRKEKKAQRKAEALLPAVDDPELRLRQRIEKLSELARSGRGEDDFSPVPRPAPAPGNLEDDPFIVERLAEAERQTAELERELKKLDEEWSVRIRDEKADDLQDDGAPPLDGNVIPLAARIRDGKK